MLAIRFVTHRSTGTVTPAGELLSPAQTAHLWGSEHSGDGMTVEYRGGSYRHLPSPAVLPAPDQTTYLRGLEQPGAGWTAKYTGVILTSPVTRGLRTERYLPIRLLRRMTSMTTLSTTAPISKLMSLMSSMSFLGVRPCCFSLHQ